MDDWGEIVLYVGYTAFTVSAIYQIVHLCRRKVSAGLSLFTTVVNMIGFILLTVFSVYLESIVGIVMNIVYLILAIVIAVLKVKYRQHQHIPDVVELRENP